MPTVFELFVTYQVLRREPLEWKSTARSTWEAASSRTHPTTRTSQTTKSIETNDDRVPALQATTMTRQFAAGDQTTCCRWPQRAGSAAAVWAGPGRGRRWAKSEPQIPEFWRKLFELRPWDIRECIRRIVMAERRELFDRTRLGLVSNIWGVESEPRTILEMNPGVFSSCGNQSWTRIWMQAENNFFKAC